MARRSMVQRTYFVSIEIEYTVRDAGTTIELAEEARRCDRSVRAVLKERSAQNVEVKVTCIQADE